MKKTLDADVIELLACDIEARPASAPGIDALMPHIERVRREAKQLIIEFAAGAAGTVEAFVAAERTCCGGIMWEWELDPAVQLRIGATPAQLDAMQAMFGAPA
jgi:hypothetical protein